MLGPESGKKPHYLALMFEMASYLLNKHKNFKVIFENDSDVKMLKKEVLINYTAYSVTPR